MISDHGRPETNKPGARLRLANLTLSDAGRDRDQGPGYMTFVTGRAIDRRARRQVLEFRILVPKPNGLSLRWLNSNGLEDEPNYSITHLKSDQVCDCH
jgi:hypothetical protein